MIVMIPFLFQFSCVVSILISCTIPFHVWTTQWWIGQVVPAIQLFFIILKIILYDKNKNNNQKEKKKKKKRGRRRRRRKQKSVSGSYWWLWGTLENKFRPCDVMVAVHMTWSSVWRVLELQWRHSWSSHSNLQSRRHARGLSSLSVSPLLSYTHHRRALCDKYSAHFLPHLVRHLQLATSEMWYWSGGKGI